MDVKKQESERTELDKGANADRSAKKRTAEILKNVFFGALYATWGYFLGGAALPFGATPFGVALLSAADRSVFYIYAGLCLSAWSRENRLLLIEIYTAVVAVRLLVCFLIDPPWKKEEEREVGERTVAQIYPRLFSEHTALRMATSAVAAFGIGLYRLIEGGMLYYDLYGTIISTVAAPLSVLIVSGFFNQSAGKYRRLVGFLALSFAIVYGVGDAKLYGIALGAAGCMFVTLYITRKGGTVLGVLSGALLGLAISVEYVPLFAFAALVSGMLFSISPSLAVGGALSISVAWGVYIQGIGILNGLASAIVSASLVYIVCDKLFIEGKTRLGSAEAVKGADAETGENAIVNAEELVRERELDHARLADARARLTGTKESFETMSEVLYGISKGLQTPSAADLKQICDNAFDSSCVSCENKPVCWGEKYRETSESLLKITAALRQKGSVSIEETDEELIAKCPRLQDILSEINHNTFLHTREMLEGDRTEVFALDYSAVAEFMSDALGERESEYTPDILQGERLRRELRERDLDVDCVCVWGERQKRISVIAEDRGYLVKNGGRIADIIAELCDYPIDGGRVDESEGVLRFCERESLSVSCAQRNLSAEGESEYCGDTSGMFRDRSGHLYAFISDGMGSGRQAALTSGIVGLFLRKFLAGGCPCESTLKLLNGFLRNRGGGSLNECSATVDLMELDLLRSRASFYKSGAAPTYVFRNGNLFKIRSRTVPVGIIRELDSRKIDLELSPNDIVVMVSDGITDGREECPWLFDLLQSQGESASTDRLADLIMKYAKAEGAIDDASVMVIKMRNGE